MSAEGGPRRRQVVLLSAGCALLVVALTLYLSGVSRAAGLWLAPLAVAVAVVGWWGTSGRRVPRWAYSLLVLAVLALTVLGVSLLVYSLAHPPRTTG